MKQFFGLLIIPFFIYATTFAQYQEGLDHSFGNKGIALSLGEEEYSFGGPELVNGAFQSDKKIIAISTQKVVRYLSNGTVDSSFGKNGFFEEPLYDDKHNALPRMTFNALEIRADDKILITGFGDLIGGPILLFCLTKDGHLDPLFGKNGVVCNTDLGSNGAFCIKLQTDGKIIIMATEYSTNYQVLARYHPNGIIDSSFGMNGKAVNGLKGISGLGQGDLALLPDGRIVAQGSDFTVSRYLTSGILDTSFDHTGMASAFPGSGFSAPIARAMVLNPDAKIWIAGYPLFGSPTPFILARLKADGSIDSSFNGIGYKEYAWDTGDENKCRDMLLLPDGKIVLGGNVMNRATKQYNFALLRIKADGDIDSTFGTNGKLITAPNKVQERRADLYKLLLQTDNKLLGLGGSSTFDPVVAFSTIARYEASGKTGIKPYQNISGQDISISPNPANDHIIINGIKEVVNIQLYNLPGQCLYTIKSSGPSINIPFQDYPAAIYIIQVSNKDGERQLFKVQKAE